ncbi:hypothetical protein Lal_00045791 [Lupinus albus]|uniref:Putative non-specific serine/threonine protein kinase n=1 Tax=Lupinus albus TaxID=3870 RepID=A0A6A4PFC3_LUPAL|nr:putative non-specific serine/threonine protein kinase [Lupinus albus]KAF1886558.1 hypothetical protein Lal_00045791 [Lupinus albus]
MDTGEPKMFCNKKQVVEAVSDRPGFHLSRVGVVEACHSLGVIHRDLRPENFYVEDVILLNPSRSRVLYIVLLVTFKNISLYFGSPNLK